MLKMIAMMILKSLLQFLGKELVNLLNNRKLQTLAVQAVENVAKMDLDNDGKRKHASETIKAQAKAIGIELKDRYANMLVEAAVNKVKVQ